MPGAQALWLAEAVASARPEAFLIGREFAHVHPPYDGSMHMMLPPEVVDEVLAKGWGEPHPMACRGLIPPTVVMVSAPRDAAEVEVILHMIGISYRFACAKGRPREGKLAVSTQWLNVPHKNLRHDLQHGPEGTKLEGGIRRKS